MRRDFFHHLLNQIRLNSKKNHVGGLGGFSIGSYSMATNLCSIGLSLGKASIGNREILPAHHLCHGLHQGAPHHTSSNTGNLYINHVFLLTNPANQRKCPKLHVLAFKKGGLHHSLSQLLQGMRFATVC